MQNKKLLIGAHVSIQNGFDQAIIRAENVGATCMQIFTKSNRQWNARAITEKQAENFIAQQKKSNIAVVIAHASYLINIGVTSIQTSKKSLHALVEELQRADLLHIPYLVLHPGTLDKSNIEHSLKIIAKNIDLAITQAKPKHTMILLETMAGQGSVAGKTFEELATILKHIKHKKFVGICVDTAHIFAAGYQFRTSADYKKMWAHFKKTIGIKKLKAMHLNDSKTELGSCVDRHEHIGHGKIGATAFKLIMHDPSLKKIAKIIETPKKEDEDAENLKNINQLKLYAQ